MAFDCCIIVRKLREYEALNEGLSLVNGQLMTCIILVMHICLVAKCFDSTLATSIKEVYKPIPAVFGQARIVDKWIILANSASSVRCIRRCSGGWSRVITFVGNKFCSPTSISLELACCRSCGNAGCTYFRLCRNLSATSSLSL